MYNNHFSLFACGNESNTINFLSNDLTLQKNVLMTTDVFQTSTTFTY